jgi:hypothetical protein
MTGPDDDDPLVLVFTPPLIDVLRELETRQGRPLTVPEVLVARDGATCEWVPYSAALARDQSCGYHDIDPAQVWDEWQQARLR